MAAAKTESVQCFGRKKMAVAVTHCKKRRRLIKINGVPIEIVLAGDPPVQGVRTYPPPRPSPLRRSGHAHTRRGRRSHLPDLRYLPVNCQSPRGLLPEICRRAVEEGD
ncbi:Uncharacterized protein Adt_07841 [Abeliophyllum distichum]|uniref:Ribosomal protein S12 n=1 Tax=Abeliophyllum distichum TaxID=126358 RepID=A0ABD1VAY1_9LAMI